MWRSIQPKRKASGFTLIEVLVSLAIIAASVSSISMLIATTMRGTHFVERQLTTVETTRAIMTALPDRDRLEIGELSGQRAGHSWHVTVSPYDAPSTTPQRDPKWLPRLVTVSVRAPDGGSLQVNTVRLSGVAGR